jgi:hypothetical protein
MMRAIKMPGCELVIGESQGYQGLPVRYDLDPAIPWHFPTNHNVITTYWEFNPEDIAAVNAGKPLVIRMLAAQHPPIELLFHDKMVA